MVLVLIAIVIIIYAIMRRDDVNGFFDKPLMEATLRDLSTVIFAFGWILVLINVGLKK